MVYTMFDPKLLDGVQTVHFIGFGVLGLLYVRTGDRIALAVQDLDQRIGAGAAAADEMDRADAFEQLGVIHTKNHNSGHLKIYPLP